MNWGFLALNEQRNTEFIVFGGLKDSRKIEECTVDAGARTVQHFDWVKNTGGSNGHRT